MIQQLDKVVLEFGYFLSEGINFFLMSLIFCFQCIALTPSFWIHLPSQTDFSCLSYAFFFLLLCRWGIFVFFVSPLLDALLKSTTFAPGAGTLPVSWTPSILKFNYMLNKQVHCFICYWALSSFDISVPSSCSSLD